MEELAEIQQQNASAPVSDSAKRVSFSETLRRVATTPVMSDEERRLRKQNEQLSQRAASVNAFINQAGPRLAKCRLSNFETKTDFQLEVIATLDEWVVTFADRRKLCEGLILYGPVGTGKDHLAFGAIGLVVHSAGLSAKWINGRQLMGQVRDRISEELSESGLIAEMSNPDILVISDPLPPIGDLTQHQADTLYRICDSRYLKNKLTVATLNVASDEEADRRLGAATWDRLCHGAWKIACMWPSYRKPARDVRPTR